jgi:hypothetical protein
MNPSYLHKQSVAFYIRLVKNVVLVNVTDN